MKRVIFYFDGFNFYNGLKDKSLIEAHWKKYYWLDLVKFCNKFLSPEHHELVKVKYFTAPPVDEQKKSRQSAFFGANTILNENKVEFIKGSYLTKPLKCNRCKSDYTGLEEKRTDVNIAVNMLLDCVHDNADLLILVTADSDQIPTVKAIKQNFIGKEVKVYFPPERSSHELSGICNPVVYLNNHENKFLEAIMPNTVTNNIKIYTKPVSWNG